MKTKFKQIFKWVMSIATTVALVSVTLITPKAWADEGFEFALAPMYEKIILNPGDNFTGSFDVINMSDGGSVIDYETEVNCYFVDENYNDIYSGDSSWCKMKDWITINSNKGGRLEADDKNSIVYTISVPENAAGGGQYATIMVTADIAKEDTDSNVGQDKSEGVDTGIKERKTIAYLIYAEITGDVIRQGDIVDVNIPSFLLSGNIIGASAIKNTGNTHGVATYKLQVFPLFSNEEIFTNEEDPQAHTILPDRTYYSETAWENTPAVGIFNVVYTAEFEGVTTQISKLVIKCPIWLLFIVVFAIVVLIIWIVMRVRTHRKKNDKKTEE